MHHGDSNMLIQVPAQKRYAPPSDNIDHTVRTHMIHANRREPGPEDPVPKGPVCDDTSQTHNSLLVTNTHAHTHLLIH